MRFSFLNRESFFLSRFATELYTTDPDQIGNNFIHLTNYSINKDSENFEQNTDPHLAKVRFSEGKESLTIKRFRDQSGR